MRRKRVDALTVKSGPTESGLPPPQPQPVGGEVLPVDKISVFLSQYWLLVVLLLLPFGLLLYKKRAAVMKLLSAWPDLR